MRRLCLLDQVLQVMNQTGGIFRVIDRSLDMTHDCRDNWMRSTDALGGADDRKEVVGETLEEEITGGRGIGFWGEDDHWEILPTIEVMGGDRRG